MPRSLVHTIPTRNRCAYNLRISATSSRSENHQAGMSFFAFCCLCDPIRSRTQAAAPVVPPHHECLSIRHSDTAAMDALFIYQYPYRIFTNPPPVN
jgi:hypothetical protein